MENESCLYRKGKDYFGHYKRITRIISLLQKVSVNKKHNFSSYLKMYIYFEP